MQPQRELRTCQIHVFEGAQSTSGNWISVQGGAMNETRKRTPDPLLKESPSLNKAAHSPPYRRMTCLEILLVAENQIETT